MADYTPIYTPGSTSTYTASAAITGGQVVEVTGDGTVGPTASAVVDVVGVAAHDAPNGGLVTVYPLPGVRHLLTASGAISAGAQVDAAASGAVAAGSTNPIGIALTAAANDVVEVLGR